MPRLAHVLIAAVLAVGLAFGFGATLAQSQTEPPAATSPAKAKKALSVEEKAERKAAKQKARQEKAAAKKAKAEQCRSEGKQSALKGKDLRAFVKKCVAG